MSRAIEMEDISGTPRSERDIREAITFIEREMITNPMAMGSGGVPYLIHYVVIRDALRELLSLRSQ